MSPMVPPISTITTSTPLDALRMLALISSVIWGMTCTVPPRYFPWRSLVMTL